MIPFHGGLLCTKLLNLLCPLVSSRKPVRTCHFESKLRNRSGSIVVVEGMVEMVVVLIVVVGTVVLVAVLMAVVASVAMKRKR